MFWGCTKKGSKWSQPYKMSTYCSSDSNTILTQINSDTIDFDTNGFWRKTIFNQKDADTKIFWHKTVLTYFDVWYKTILIQNNSYTKQFWHKAQNWLFVSEFFVCFMSELFLSEQKGVITSLCQNHFVSEALLCRNCIVLEIIYWHCKIWTYYEGTSTMCQISFQADFILLRFSN